MSRLRNNFLFLALCPFLLGQAWARDAAVTAVAALIDPATLVTLRGDRAANPRVLKCVYWLNDARRRGIEPAAVIDEAQVLNQSAQQPRAPLVQTALLRDLDIAGKLGCLTSGNLERMRHGKSPVISRGPYIGEPAEVDHVVPSRGASLGSRDCEPGIDASHAEPSQRGDHGSAATGVSREIPRRGFARDRVWRVAPGQSRS